MLEWTEILLRLALAAFFGALVGIERERKDWAAGMRTHMMVCTGSALMMMVSAFGFSDILGTPHVELDPSRVAAQVVSGIGFLGAGTILFLKPATVKGLTTASGLWTIAGIGLATGGGMYFAAIAATVISLIILYGLQLVQKKFSYQMSGRKSLHVVVKDKSASQALLAKILHFPSLEFTEITIGKSEKGYALHVILRNARKKEVVALTDEIQSIASVDQINWN